MANDPRYAALIEEIEANYPKMPESIFRQFVPYFLSPETLSAEETERLRGEWLKYALDPRLSVHVMSEDGKELLFRVPPMVYTTTDLTGHNVAGMLKEWVLRTEANALLGAAFAREHITADLIVGSPPEADVEAWRTIILRYNQDGRPSASDDVELEDLADW